MFGLGLEAALAEFGVWTTAKGRSSLGSCFLANQFFQ